MLTEPPTLPMSAEGSEPLSRHNRLATRDCGELEHFLSSKRLAIDFPASREIPSRRDLDAIINAYYLPGSYLSYMRYRSPVEIAARDERPDFSLSIPIAGRFRAHIGNDFVLGHGQQGTLGSPTRDQFTHLEARSSRYGISINAAAMVDQLEDMLGRPVAEPLVFKPDIDLHAGKGKAIRGLIDFAVNALDESVDGFGNARVETQFEQLLMSYLLIGQAHNYSDDLHAPCAQIAPRDVRRVIDYIQSHLEEPITLGCLVAVSGVPGRTLNEHFKRVTGYSPLAYVTQQRLLAARRELLEAAPGATVTAIASRWGFAQLGRFAQRYRSVYGERPSETLRRRRTD